MKKPSIDQVQPVICGAWVNGYSIARAFHERFQLRSIILTQVESITQWSKICETKFVPDPKTEIEKVLDKIREIGAELRKKGKIPCLFVTNDEWLIPLAKNQIESFLYSFPSWNIISQLNDKALLVSLAKKLNIAVPYSAPVYKRSDLDLTGTRPPYILKPFNQIEYATLFLHEYRNQVYQSADELEAALEAKIAAGYSGGFQLQEYIPGGCENLYTLSSFSDRNGKLKGISIGHKLTQHPPQAGTITSGRVRFEQRLVEPTRQLLESVGFYGIANTEFKYDALTDQFRLIEVNPRPGMWNYSCCASGVNFFEQFVRSFVFKEDLEDQFGTRELIWTISRSNRAARAGSKELPVVNPLEYFEESWQFKRKVRLLTWKNWLFQEMPIIAGYLGGLKSIFRQAKR